MSKSADVFTNEANILLLFVLNINLKFNVKLFFFFIRIKNSTTRSDKKVIQSKLFYLCVDLLRKNISEIGSI